VPTASLVEPLGSSSFSLPTAEHVLVEMWGAAALAHSWSRETRGRTDVANPRERTKPDAAQGVAELRPELAES
jgi:hypothetical protein